MPVMVLVVMGLVEECERNSAEQIGIAYHACVEYLALHHEQGTLIIGFGVHKHSGGAGDLDVGDEVGLGDRTRALCHRSEAGLGVHDCGIAVYSTFAWVEGGITME